ncbi:MAG: serine protease [Pseudomonadota bacterium]|nr:serine protease [Pseudomonadota bacterium]
MLLLLPVAFAADPVALEPFRVGSVDRETLGTTLEDWTPVLTEALVKAGSPVEPGSKARLSATVRTSSCLRAPKARSCEIAVSWELRLEPGAPVSYRVVTRGIGDDRGRGDGAARAALEDAAARLVARPRFNERTAVAAVEPAPSWSGALSLKSCARPAMKLPAEMDMALHATVVIASGASMGSGVLISPDGWVLTAAHVVGDSATPTVRTRGGITAPATVVRLDRAHDLALLRTTAGDGACLPLQTATPPPGTEVFAIGSPLGQGLEFSVSKGVISGMREVKGRRFLQTDASVNSGNSGGPLVDETGKVVAIVSWKVLGDGLEGIAFGVPVESALTRLDFSFGASSTEGASVGVRAVAKEVGVDDIPDPSRLVRPKSNVSPVPTISGLALGVAGAGLIIGTFGWYGGAVDDDDATVEGWRIAQGLNAAGWGLAAGGVGLVFIPMLTTNGAGAAATVSF